MKPTTWRTNVWKTSPVKKFYRAPISWIKWLFRAIKWSYQRATRGYCEYDLWGLNDYYAEMFYNSLHHFAEVAEGYPGIYENDDTPWESWTKDIKAVADCFGVWMEDEGKLWEDYWNRVDELREAHPDSTTIGLETIDHELLTLKNKAVKDTQKLERKKSDCVWEGCDMLGQFFAMLWD